MTGSPACTSPPSGATTYTYDTNGRRTKTTPATGSASSYTYNQANQLTAATTLAGSGAYTYDGTGLRASKTSGGTTTAFTWGDLNGTNLLLTDGTTNYLYGPGNKPIEQSTPGSTCYYVTDQNHNTVALTNTTGAIAGTYTYNTYGQTTAHTGGASTPLQYGGGYTDNETGLLYLQARYYDPATGIFLTIDPALAITGQPYAYVADDPLNLTDRTGLWFGLDDLIATGVGAVVGAGTSIVEQAVSGHGVNWSKVGIAAGAGAAGGEASLYCGFFCGGAVASGLNEVGNELYDRGSIDPVHVAESSIIGGGFGYLGGALLGDMGLGAHSLPSDGDPGLGGQVGVGFGTVVGGDYTGGFLWDPFGTIKRLWHSCH